MLLLLLLLLTKECLTKFIIIRHCQGAKRVLLIPPSKNEMSAGSPLHYQRNETEPLTAKDLNMLGFSKEDLETKGQFRILPLQHLDDDSDIPDRFERIQGVEMSLPEPDSMAEETAEADPETDFPADADFGVFVPLFSGEEDFMNL